jgi:hypothetical protein
MQKKLIASLTLCSFVLSACGGKKDSKPPPPKLGSASPLADLVMNKLEDAPDGIDLRVSEGKQGAPAYDRAKIAAAKKLTPQDVNALLARAKPITTDPSDQAAFALRPNSQPPPRTGQTIKGQFPVPGEQGPPRAPLHAGGQGPDRARAQRHVLDADGRGDVARRRRSDEAREAHARAERQVALARHAHDPV